MLSCRVVDAGTAATAAAAAASAPNSKNRSEMVWRWCGGMLGGSRCNTRRYALFNSIVLSRCVLRLGRDRERRWGNTSHRLQSKGVSAL